MSENGGMRRLGKEGLLRESMSVLAENSQASMLEIAKAIGVGRTTLYRHFGDRETLVAGVARLGARMFGDAFMGARPSEGSGLTAVERVCEGLFTVPDALTLMFADNPIITDDVFAEVERERRTRVEGSVAAEDDDAEADDGLERVIARGQADGSITTGVPVVWAAMYVFLTIGSGHLFSATAGPVDRARALGLTIRAVRKVLSVEDADSADDSAGNRNGE